MEKILKLCSCCFPKLKSDDNEFFLTSKEDEFVSHKLTSFSAEQLQSILVEKEAEKAEYLLKGDDASKRQQAAIEELSSLKLERKKLRLAYNGHLDAVYPKTLNEATNKAMKSFKMMIEALGDLVEACQLKFIANQAIINQIKEHLNASKNEDAKGIIE